MLTTARHTRSAATHATITRHIDAPIDTVFSLLADVHWPRWGSFTDTATPRTSTGPALPYSIRLGRHSCASLTPPRTTRAGSATG